MNTMMQTTNSNPAMMAVTTSNSELIPMRRTFDFNSDPVQIMDLQTLKRTHYEDGDDGSPLRGVYHFQAIEKVVTMCNKYNLDYAVEEIFAAQNRSKDAPGVSLLKKVEVQYGEKAVEAHILRRIFTTIRINNFETDELTTTIALAYHQDGIQAAIGPCVKVCHNQCIMGGGRRAATYGKNKLTVEELFETIDGWLSEFENHMIEDREKIARLKSIVVTEQDIYTYIGMLTALRVAHDSADRELSGMVADGYPLSQSQISTFTETMLKMLRTRPVITAWNLYNVGTELLNPEKMSIPSLVNQGVNLTASLEQFFGLNQPLSSIPQVITVEAQSVS